MTDIKYGSKYQKDRDVKEIAKDVRIDIAQAVRVGQLPKTKYSVTISRFAGGRSIDISARHEDFKFGTETRKAYGALLNAILAAYNFDGSDTMTDYFHVNFYGGVNLGTPTEGESRA